MTSPCIIIPTKDRPGLLKEAVRSALNALPRDAGEVLVVDDGSIPPAAESLGRIADPRLRLVVNPGPHGPSAARNFGVTQTDADTVLFLDDDDLMVPGYAAWVLSLREACPDVAYGFADIHRFEGSTTLPARFDGEAERVAGLPFKRQIGGLGCGFWIDRSLFQRLGGIAEDIRVNEDTDFSIRLLGSGAKGRRATAPAVHVRSHAAVTDLGHVTHRTHAAERARYFEMILDRNRDWLSRNRHAERHILKRLLKMHAKAGQQEEAQKVLERPGAARLWPYYLANALLYRIRR